MRFNFTDEIPYELDLVYRTHRDKLPELAAYIPNVDSIVIEEREEEGDVVRLLNLWTAGESDIPKLARSFIKPDMLRWKDRAVWDESAKDCHWELDLQFLPGAIEARGVNTFEDDGDATTINMSGEFIIHMDRIPGVPKMLHGKLKPVIEKFVIGLVEPNLRKTNEAATQYLQDTHRG